jgi:hypothetical protein
MFRRTCAPGTLLLAVLVCPVLASAQIDIALKRSFIDRYKDRATIDATFTVDKAHAHPNAPANDADLHIAGRAPEIGLPTVAEIMNAALDPDALTLVHDAERSGEPLAISGAWRIWCEHGGQDTQRQGAPLEPFKTTNPNHVFEIHPITKIGTHDTSPSFVSIAGFTPKDAMDAFDRYESKTSAIKVTGSGKTVTITTSGLGYNYVDFQIVLNEAPRDVSDGAMVMAEVLDLEGELLVHKRRMVFVAGTGPYNVVRSAQVGDTLRVLGIPRVNLALVAWRVDHRSSRPEALKWNLPYEMIIVATAAREQ